MMTIETVLERIKELEKTNAWYAMQLLRKNRRIEELETKLNPPEPARGQFGYSVSATRRRIYRRAPEMIKRPLRKIGYWAHDRIMWWLSCEWENGETGHRTPLRIVFKILKEDSEYIRRLQESGKDEG